jgi:hypothetical protein
MAEVPHLKYGISINTLEYDAKWEPNAPSPEMRLNSLINAKFWGLDTFESIEPMRRNSILPILQHKISLECCDDFILGKLNPGNQFNRYLRAYIPEAIQFLDENKKRFLIKRELAKVCGYYVEPKVETKAEVKKTKRLEDYC